jgi:hypothetical protein
MLSWLITRVRFYGAITLVALYAVCVVLPSVRLAVTSGSAPSHCLTDHHRGVSEVRLQDGIHVHGSIYVDGDGAMDKHADNSKEGGDGKLKCHAGACCGFFCCAAITWDSGATVVQPVHAALLFGALDERLDGRGPQRIGRPPKSFLSL